MPGPALSHPGLLLEDCLQAFGGQESRSRRRGAGGHERNACARAAGCSGPGGAGRGGAGSVVWSRELAPLGSGWGSPLPFSLDLAEAPGKRGLSVEQCLWLSGPSPPFVTWKSKACPFWGSPLIGPVSSSCPGDPGAKPNVMACWPGPRLSPPGGHPSQPRLQSLLTGSHSGLGPNLEFRQQREAPGRWGVGSEADREEEDGTPVPKSESGLMALVISNAARACGCGHQSHYMPGGARRRPSASWPGGIKAHMSISGCPRGVCRPERLESFRCFSPRGS